MERPRGLLERAGRWIAPGWFLGGALIAFTLCSVIGNSWVLRDPLLRVVRIHRPISLEASYQITALQAYALVKAQARHDRPTIVIGGSSIMNGAGQRSGRVWSELLAHHLAGRATVINVALRGGALQELGQFMTEALIKEGFPVIHVADGLSGCGIQGDPTGFRHKYLFWDARHRGLLLESAERETRLTTLLSGTREGAEQARELRRALWLNSRAKLAFNDLWSMVGYRYLFTVWTVGADGTFWRPREALGDDTPLMRGGAYYHLLPADEAMQSVRSLARPCPPWALAALEADLRAMIPAAVRFRTVIVLIRPTPYFFDRLGPAEKERYEEGRRRMAEFLAGLGIRYVDATRGLSASDYLDMGHLAESGGEKLAGTVAASLIAQWPAFIGTAHHDGLASSASGTARSPGAPTEASP